jgi:hypothetical protein
MRSSAHLPDTAPEGPRMGDDKQLGPGVSRYGTIAPRGGIDRPTVPSARYFILLGAASPLDHPASSWGGPWP